MIHVKKIENIITSKIKTGYYPELVTPETMKLLRSTTSKITKDENGEYVVYSEVTEVVLIIVILLATIIRKMQESCIHLFVINHLVNY